MGIFRKVEESIMNFLSLKPNVFIIQLIIYFMIGWIMSDHLTIGQFILMFVIILVLQVLTRIQGVADGMVLNQLMHDKIEPDNELRQQVMKEMKRIWKEQDMENHDE